MRVLRRAGNVRTLVGQAKGQTVSTLPSGPILRGMPRLAGFDGLDGAGMEGRFADADADAPGCAGAPSGSVTLRARRGVVEGCERGRTGFCTDGADEWPRASGGFQISTYFSACAAEAAVSAASVTNAASERRPAFIAQSPCLVRLSGSHPDTVYPYSFLRNWFAQQSTALGRSGRTNKNRASQSRDARLDIRHKAVAARSERVADTDHADELRRA